MKTTWGKVLLTLAALAVLSNQYFVEDQFYARIISFTTILCLAFGIWLVTPFSLLPLIIFDVQEWKKNATVEELIKKLRLRGLLFNNIAVIIFIITLLVIIIGFYLLARTPTTTEIETQPLRIITLSYSQILYVLSMNILALRSAPFLPFRSLRTIQVRALHS